MLTALCAAAALVAQKRIAPQSPEDAANFKLLSDALKLRTDAADAIVQGREASAASVIRLKASASPTGLIDCLTVSMKDFC